MSRLSTLLAMSVLACPAATTAQSLWLGAKAGLDRAAWTGDFGVPFNPFGTRTGLTAGATVSLGLKDIVALQLEALYSEKGAAGPGEFRASVAYLELPLLVKVALPPRALNIRPIALAGLAPALEISCGVLAQPAYIPEQPPPPPEQMNCISWRTEPRDVGVVLAGGIEVPVGRVNVTAEIRRTTGRRNIALGYAPLSTYNNVWSFMIGTAFAVPR